MLVSANMTGGRFARGAYCRGVRPLAQVKPAFGLDECQVLWPWGVITAWDLVIQ